MKLDDVFELQQETIRRIREELKNNPLVFGNVTIDYLYRRGSQKAIDNNYIDVSFTLINPSFNHKCRDDTIRVEFDIYSTNEILTNRIAMHFANFVEKKKIDKVRYILDVRVSGGVAELNKNSYVQRVIGVIRV